MIRAGCREFDRREREDRELGRLRHAIYEGDKAVRELQRQFRAIVYRRRRRELALLRRHGIEP
jgi:hypothetical protein